MITSQTNFLRTGIPHILSFIITAIFVCFFSNSQFVGGRFLNFLILCFPAFLIFTGELLRDSNNTIVMIFGREIDLYLAQIILTILYFFLFSILLQYNIIFWKGEEVKWISTFKYQSDSIHRNSEEHGFKGKSWFNLQFTDLKMGDKRAGGAGFLDREKKIDPFEEIKFEKNAVFKINYEANYRLIAIFSLENKNDTQFTEFQIKIIEPGQHSLTIYFDDFTKKNSKEFQNKELNELFFKHLKVNMIATDSWLDYIFVKIFGKSIAHSYL